MQKANHHCASSRFNRHAATLFTVVFLVAMAMATGGCRKEEKRPAP